MVDSLRTLIGPKNMVLLDAGNVHGFQKNDVSDREADFIVRMMNRQKYDVAMLGPKDYTQIDSSRAAMLGAAEFPWVGTNYAEGVRPKGVVETWTTKVDGVKIGIFSWVDPAWQGNSMKAEELKDNLEATAKALRKSCDVVAMVAYTNVQEPEVLARRVNGLVDMMILGGVNSPAMSVKQEGNVYIGNSGDRGRHIARFDLLLNREKKIVKTDYAVVVLGHELPVDPQVTQLMADFQTEQTRIKAANLEKIRMARLAEFNIDPATLPGANSTLSYTGEKDCRDCHMDIYNSWRQTVHGRTFSDLIRNRESEQEMKVRRAVTGWMETTGFIDRRESSHMYNVQCESCHGRGSEHVKTKGGALETLVAPESTCLRCHDSANSPNFDLAAGLKLAHPPLTPEQLKEMQKSPAGGLAPGDKMKLEGAPKPAPTNVGTTPIPASTAPGQTSPNKPANEKGLPPAANTGAKQVSPVNNKPVEGKKKPATDGTAPPAGSGTK